MVVPNVVVLLLIGTQHWLLRHYGTSSRPDLDTSRELSATESQRRARLGCAYPLKTPAGAHEIRALGYAHVTTCCPGARPANDHSVSSETDEATPGHLRRRVSLFSTVGGVATSTNLRLRFALLMKPIAGA